MSSEAIIDALARFEQNVESDQAAATDALAELVTEYSENRVSEEIFTRRAATLPGTLTEKSASDKVNDLMGASVTAGFQRAGFITSGATVLETGDESEYETVKNHARQLRETEEQYLAASKDAKAIVDSASLPPVIELFSFSPTEEVLPKGATDDVTGEVTNVGDDRLEAIEYDIEAEDGISVRATSGLVESLSANARHQATLRVEGVRTGRHSLTVVATGVEDKTRSYAEVTLTVRDKSQLLAGAIEIIRGMVDRIDESTLNRGVKNALTSKLETTEKKVLRGQDAAFAGKAKKADREISTASNTVSAFANQIENDGLDANQSGKKNSNSKSHIPAQLKNVLLGQTASLEELLNQAEVAAL
ncbi:hypothetical protein [Haloferax sp. DFSO60]|uniref:COG1470 family protein n=1 Tax=Haloferax sp. DFSO60 TaxID=3388652 RepID=UPI00397E3154